MNGNYVHRTLCNGIINPVVSDGVSTEAQVRAAIKAGL